MSATREDMNRLFGVTDLSGMTIYIGELARITTKALTAEGWTIEYHNHCNGRVTIDCRPPSDGHAAQNLHTIEITA